MSLAKETLPIILNILCHRFQSLSTPEISQSIRRSFRWQLGTNLGPFLAALLALQEKKKIRMMEERRGRAVRGLPRGSFLSPHLLMASDLMQDPHNRDNGCGTGSCPDQGIEKQSDQSEYFDQH
jgi:hypothetical protein